MKNDWSATLAPAAPPAGVVGLHFLGMPLETWVLLCTLAYTGLATVKLVWDWVRKARDGSKQ